jgi:hypothetical protein
MNDVRASTAPHHTKTMLYMEDPSLLLLHNVPTSLISAPSSGHMPNQQTVHQFGSRRKAQIGMNSLEDKEQ